MKTPSIPPHLKKYVVKQNYSRYTPEDQAVWRYIMRQLAHFLGKHAHDCYLDGLEKTGISINQIPKISDMDKKLKKFGWGAVPVSGFIPPAAFMEFQARGFLPIASDMRTMDHLLYTPAPDIVHEAAGHAPIIVDKGFANYLKAYAKVASKAIINREDLEQYRLIRKLSDLKENPDSKPSVIAKAEKDLMTISKRMSHTSEAAVLSRMNWWTAEYGLIGTIQKPKIFGAGLLSSLGESRECLSENVKKIPLSLDCINYAYDITEPQPQLFVTPNFETLTEVLNELAKTMAFSTGGEAGLMKAKEAETVNTVELNSGLQISGQFLDYLVNKSGKPVYLKFTGPCQLSYGYKELPGHGKKYHAQGYGTPVGQLVNFKKSLHLVTREERKALGLEVGSHCVLKFKSRVHVDGTVKNLIFNKKGELIVVGFTDCEVTINSSVLFSREWGDFDMAVGSQIPSVYGGPADRIKYGDLEDFAVERVPSKKYDLPTRSRHDFFKKTRALREAKGLRNDKMQKLETLAAEFFKSKNVNWLNGLELLELCHHLEAKASLSEKIQKTLNQMVKDEKQKKELADGIALLPAPL